MNSMKESKINKTTRIKNGFFGIILIFFIFNMFLSGILNITSQIKIIKNKNFIMAELKNNVSDEKKEELEKKFLGLKEITKITYTSSYTSFQELQKELGIAIPRGENPLPNTFRIYFNNPNDLEKLRTTLENTDEIKEFFMDDLYITDIHRRVNILNLFGIVCIIISLFSLIIFNVIWKFQIETEYLINLIKDEHNPRNLIKAKNINVLLTTIAIGIGTALYFNVYIIIRKMLINSKLLVDVLSFLEILPIQFGVVLLIALYVWFMPVERKKRKQEKNDEDR